MSGWEAFLLGILQGLTEFLPVSSSGHLEIGKYLMGEIPESLNFTVAVHGATVLSTIVVFRKDLFRLFKGLFEFRWNQETIYLAKLILSAVPVAIIGLMFKDQIEGLFGGKIRFVGAMLIITGFLLAVASWVPSGKRKISWLDAFVIGVAQAVAVLPGISRSGSTIVTALLLGNDREEATRFSFLMVLLPVLGANFVEIVSGDFSSGGGAGTGAVVIGAIAAFVAGLFACRWMISLVKKGKLWYFALYCLTIGGLAFFLN